MNKGISYRGCDLRDRDFRFADLRGADLRGANLCGCNFRNADLSGVLVDESTRYDETTCFFALQCPEEGAFIGFKRCGGCIVKLLIPEDARRSSATNRCCRCDKAKVLAIEHLDGTPADIQCIASDEMPGFLYPVGKMVYADRFDPDRWIEQTHGIHFFITRMEAVQYGD